MSDNKPNHPVTGVAEHREIQETLLNRAWRLIGLLVLLATCLLFTRAYFVGWSPSYTLSTIGMVSVFITSLSYRWLNYQLKAFLFIFFFIVLAVYEYLVWGTVISLERDIIGAILVALIFLGRRSAYVTAAICMLLMSGVGYLTVTSVDPTPLSRGLDYKATATWVSIIGNFFFLFLPLMIIVAEIGHHLAQKYERLKQLNQQLDESSRALQQSEIARQAAEIANQRKSEYLTDVSHEIRTPLNGVVGALELLKLSGLNREQLGMTQTAEHCTESLLSLINNILDFSRIEAGEMALTCKPYSIVKLAQESLKVVESRAIRKRLYLTLNDFSDIPQSMVCDGLRLKQILINLLSNAINFTTEGGVVLTLERDQQQLRLRVRDTGVGIEPDQLPLIFRPYRQAPDLQSGSGLGLAISSKLAQMMGGDLTVESEVGLGSTFTLTLPVELPETVEPGEDSALVLSPEPQEQLQTAELNILLVDDIATNRELTCKMLTKLGQRVVQARSGQEALKIAQEQVFDLVLMDIRLPDIDGVEVTRLWRRELAEVLDPGCYIVALTANAHPVERSALLEELMNDYLVKPVTLMQLARVVEKACVFQQARGVTLHSAPRVDTATHFHAEPDLMELAHHELIGLYRKAHDAFIEEDTEQLSYLLHALKGCAANVGLVGIRAMVEDLEDLLPYPSEKDFVRLACAIEQLQPPTGKR
ncbi:ATP-binding protein [Dongshaea marina]|uniref:ATP-binding protein n=1 Tax=Dongshaea marina TaxID=2047966 RepID=UPI000D3E6DA2|nr:ATP-binding protein [Dongshaea marina]